MALDQSALLQLLEVMRSADGGDLMRRLLATMLQLVKVVEGVARPVHTEAAAGDLGEQGAHRLEVAVRGGHRHQSVAGGRAAGPVQRVPSFAGQVFQPDASRAAVALPVGVGVVGDDVASGAGRGDMPPARMI